MKSLPLSLDKNSLVAACGKLSAFDPHFRRVYELYGTPPLWDRPAGFATLLNIILEQQVSLASARACFERLNATLGIVTPAGLMALDDAELKIIGFSRQKTAYARHLSEAVIENRIYFEHLHALSDAEVKSELIKLKGVGEWTSDIYLLMAMLRPDVMPKGDIALHAAYQKLTCAAARPG